MEKTKQTIDACCEKKEKRKRGGGEWAVAKPARETIIREAKKDQKYIRDGWWLPWLHFPCLWALKGGLRDAAGALNLAVPCPQKWPSRQTISRNPHGTPLFNSVIGTWHPRLANGRLACAPTPCQLRTAKITSR